MPIIHVHSPQEIITLFPREVPKAGTVALDKLRAVGAQAVVCEPGFFGCITPPLLKPLLPRRAELWLAVDATGEVANLTYSSSRDVQTLMTKRLEGGELEATVSLGGKIAPLGAEYGKNFSVSAPAGHGFSRRELLGSLVMYRNAEEAREVLDSFASQAPPPPPENV
jgi:hypothetical protein